jgi:hypothetical protein
MRLDHYWWALADLPAEIQGYDLIGDRHDKAHVMLDKQNGDAAIAADLQNHGRQFFHFLVI